MNKWIYGIVGALFFVSAIGIGVALAISENTSQVVHDEKEKVEEVKEPPKEMIKDFASDIGITEEQFRTVYNSVVSKKNSKLLISKQNPHITDGIETYEVSFDKSLAVLICSYSATDKVKGIVLSSSANNDTEWNQMVAVVNALLETVEPNMTVQQRREILDELQMPYSGINVSKHNYKGLDNRVKRDERKYILYGDRGISFCILGGDVIFDIDGAKKGARSASNLVSDIIAYDQWLSQQPDSVYNKAFPSEIVNKWMAIVEKYDKQIRMLAEECNKDPSKERAKLLKQKAHDIGSEIYESRQGLARDSVHLTDDEYDKIDSMLLVESYRTSYLENGLFSVYLGQDPSIDYKLGGENKERYDSLYAEFCKKYK